MPPKYVIIVAVYLKQTFQLVHIAPKWKYAFEVSYAGELLLRLKQHQPVFRTEDLQTGAVAQLLQVVYVFGVVALVLVSKVEKSLLFFFLDLLEILLGVVFDPDEIQNISEKSVLDLPVDGRRGAETRANIDLHKPRLKFIVNQNIKAIELKPTSSFVLRF